MEYHPAISVCMPMYNASRYLRECIDSVLAQTFTDFEFLIADDGSTDNSVEIVESYSDPRIRLIKREHGYISTLNCLLDEAKGEYIARMDADDIMTPTRLQIEHDYLSTHPSIMAVCSQAIKIDYNSQPITRIGNGTSVVRITPRMMCEANHICNPTSMMRSSIVKQGGLKYERDYEYAEDYRLWCRIVVDFGPIDCLPQQLLYYRISETQVTSQHYDEMMRKTNQIKSHIITELVNRVNFGYTEPQITGGDCDLTLIIPFLNEGAEVENTIKSFQQFGGNQMNIIAINDCSYDSYPYMERLTAIDGVTYVLNRRRLGVAASRDKGVSLCQTPYFLLLDAHMRAYDDTWLTEIPNLLQNDDRRILCCQTRALSYDNFGNIITQDYRPHFGAKLTFTPNCLMPGIEWITEERQKDSDYEIVPAVLGAGYGASKYYWNHIGGLRGLQQYGCDEQMLSLKTWLEGGECVLLKRVVLGHIYRERMPYSYNHSVSILNSLIISETLFPIKEKCKARAYAFSIDPQLFKSAYAMCYKIIESDSLVTNWGKSPVCRPFNEIKELNHISSTLENKLESIITERLLDVANIITTEEAPNVGVFDGKAAYAIWLFLYALYSNCNLFYNRAHTLLYEAIHECDFSNLSFKDGLPGIGWAILYLHLTGIIKSLPAEFHDIDLAISEYITSSNSLSDNLSFSDGLSGILAYYCIRSLRGLNPSIQTKLDKISTKILSSSNNITAIEAFYAFAWQELASTVPLQQDIQWSLTDWIVPIQLLPKDKRFWKLSLNKGTLATTIPVLLQHTRLINYEKK